MSKICLKDVIAKLESGSRPKGGASTSEGIPSLGAEHLSYEGRIAFRKPKYIEQSFYDQLKSGILKDQDVLIVKDGATTGKVSIWMSEFEEACINEHVFRLEIVPSKALPKYIFYFLISPYGNNQVLKDFRGATVGGISRSFVDKVKMTLPSLSEQKQIVQTLDTADTIRQKRKEQLNLLDDYLKSVFFEMFGDLVINDKEWKTTDVNSVIDGTDSGWSPVCLDTQRQTDETPVILKLSAVTYCYFNPKNHKVIPANIKIEKRVEVKKQDLLFTRKNTKELVAASAFVFDCERNLLLPDTIFRLNYKKELVNGIYLWKLFVEEGFRKVIQNLATGSAGSMPNISKEKLRKLLIPIPPLQLQNKFASIVEQVEQTKQKMRASLNEMDNHFNALIQRYFG